MKLSRNVILSCEILAAHKLRTLLSVVGIVVGVAAVTVIVSAGRGAQEQIMERIREMGTNLIVVKAGQTKVIGGRERQMSIVTTLEPDDAEAIREQCPAVSRAAPAIDKNLKAEWRSEESKPQVVGISPEGFDIRNYRMASGRAFDDYQNRGRRRVAVLGPTVVEDLFGDADPVGARIRIDRVPFNVIGVTEAKGMDANGNDQDDIILVPLKTMMSRLANVTYIKTIYVQAESSDRLHEAEEQIRPVLRERHRLREDDPDDFTIQNQAELLETQRETSRSMTLLVGSVAGISLMVGGVGILAVMLIGVKERTEEIGLRRAIGARQKDIAAQFLMEAALLSGGGGIAGLLLGLGTTWGISAFSSWPVVMSWIPGVGAVIFSLVLGTAFGFYPALQAARLEPIEALQTE